MTDKSYQPTVAGLRAFVAVAEKRHFSGAATTLGVSQSTLSQALAALESGLGAPLIERSTRRVFLTPEGAQLLPHAQAVIEAVDAFTTAAAGTSDPLQRQHPAGTDPHGGTVRTADAARRAGRASCRTLTLRVIEDQTERLLTALRAGALDAALIALPADAPGVTAIPIYDEDFVLALPPGHALSGKRRVPAAALADLPLLLLDEGHCLRDQALDVCHKAGVRAGAGQYPGRLAGDRRAVRQRRTGGDAHPAERGTRRGDAQPTGPGAVRRATSRSTDRPGVPLVQRSRRALPAAGAHDRHGDRPQPPGAAGQVGSPHGEGHRSADACRLGRGVVRAAARPGRRRAAGARPARAGRSTSATTRCAGR